MKTLYLSLAAALLAGASAAADAASIGLSTNYNLGFVVNIDTGEAGGVTYDWDTGRLRAVGDEAIWGDYSTVDGSGSQVGGITTYRDPEAITYMGGGTYALGQERTMKINELPYNNGVPREQDSRSFCIQGCINVGNTGLEGISYDRRTGDFYAVKETGPQAVWRLTGVDFAGNGTVEELFNADLLGLATISDISVLSNSTAFFGTDTDDNLLILSATNNVLLEVSKTGTILDTLDLGFTGVGKIEGVTLDDLGNIYLVGEEGPGFRSGLIKLERSVAPVPEPATWAMMIAGFGLVGSAMRRRTVKVAFAA